MSTTTVTPVVAVSKKQEPKLEEVKVTIESGKESAAILYITTTKAIELAFGLQDAYDNPSQYQRDALQDASVMFLKAQCQRAVTTFDNLVTKLSKTQKYMNMSRSEVEQAAKVHPKFAAFWKQAERAIAIKRDLR